MKVDEREQFVFENKAGSCKISLFVDGISVSRCRINHKGKTWTISAWYTRDGYEHQGYGKKTMFFLLRQMKALYGIPEKVEYIWNGENAYVYEWLNDNFGAVSKCPVAVQKYATDDDWMSHVYVLNRDKFLQYFNLKKEA